MKNRQYAVIGTVAGLGVMGSQLLLNKHKELSHGIAMGKQHS